MKSFLGLALATLASASPVLIDTIHNGVAPLVSATNGKGIQDSYLIKFKEHVTEKHAADHHNWVQGVHMDTQNAKSELRKRSLTPMVDDIFGGLTHTYNIAGGLLGYSGHFDADVIEQIRRHPDVSCYQCYRAKRGYIGGGGSSSSSVNVTSCVLVSNCGN